MAVLITLMTMPRPTGASILARIHWMPATRAGMTDEADVVSTARRQSQLGDEPA
jgi:hypothetical protein